MTSTAAGPIGMAFFLFIDCKPHKLVPVVPLRIPTLSRTLISSLFALPATWVYGIYIIASLVFRSLVQVINILKLPTRRRNLAPRSARSQSTPNPTSPDRAFRRRSRSHRFARMALISPHIYWMIPIFSGCVWLAMLLAMLLWWTVQQHSRHITPMSENQRIA